MSTKHAVSLLSLLSLPISRTHRKAVHTTRPTFRPLTGFALLGGDVVTGEQPNCMVNVVAQRDASLPTGLPRNLLTSLFCPKGEHLCTALPFRFSVFHSKSVGYLNRLSSRKTGANTAVYSQPPEHIVDDRIVAAKNTAFMGHILPVTFPVGVAFGSP